MTKHSERVKERVIQSGQAIGGKKGGGLKLFSKNHVAKVHRDDDGGYDYTVKKNKVKIPTFFLNFFLLDALFYIMFYQLDKVVAMIKYLVGLYNEYIGWHPPSEGGEPAVTTPIWMSQILMLVAAAVIIAVVYYKKFYGVRGWHGCEHKCIQSAMNNDIDNIEDYDRTVTNCGTTYIVSIVLYMLLYMQFIGVVGVFSTLVVFMMVEKYYWHRYNIVGIKVGMFLQKYIMTEEPEDWQLSVTAEAGKALIEKETHVPYEELKEHAARWKT